MNCRPGCGACCIGLSISSAIPGMPQGKPAGVRCVQLTEDLRCAIWNDPRRPKACAGLQPNEEMCGAEDQPIGVTREHALRWIAALELATAPPGGAGVGNPI